MALRSWNEIEKSPGYTSLPDDKKQQVRQRYQERVAEAASLYLAPTDQTGGPSTAYRGSNAFLRGFSNAAALPGMAIDAGNWLTGKINPNWKVDNPVGGSEQIRSGWNALLGVQDFPPGNKPQQYLEKTAEFAGAGMMPGASVIGAAARPVQAAVVEGAAALAGGAGSQFGGDVGGQFGGTPEAQARNRAIGETVGSFGGFVPIASTGLGLKMANKAQNMWTNRQAMADNKVNQGLKAALEGYEQNIPASMDVGRKLGVNFDLAQASGAPAIAALARSHEAVSPHALSQATRHYDDVIAGINLNREQMFPPGSVEGVKPAQEAVTAAQSRYGQRVDQLEGAQAKLGQQFDYQPNDVIGQRLRAIRDEREIGTKAAVGKQYEQLYRAADDKGVQVPMDDVGQWLKMRFGDDAYKFQDKPAIFGDAYRLYKGKELPKMPPAKNARDFDAQKSLAQQAAAEKPVVSFQEFHSLWKQVNRDIGRYKNDPQTLGQLNELKAILQNKVGALESSGEIGQQFRSANKNYQEQVVDVYRKGAGGKMEATGRYGDVVQDENIVKNLLFKSGGAQGMDDFMRIYGKDPEAKTLLRNGVMDVFAKEVVKDGKIVPSSAEAFFKKYDQALNRVPDIKAELLKTDRVNDVLIARRQDVLAKEAEFGKTKVAKILQVEDTEEALNRAMNSKKLMFTLSAKAAKDPEAAKSWGRAIADKVMEQKDPYEFLLKNEGLLKPAMSKLGNKHFDNLKLIAQGQSIAQRNTPSNIVHMPTGGDLLKDKTGISTGEASAVWRNVQRGRTSFQQEGIGLLGKVVGKISKEKMMELERAAIYDPDIADTLAKLSTMKTITPALENKLRHHAFSAGIRMTAEAGEEQ